MKIRKCFVLAGLFLFSYAFADKIEITRLEPSSWWIGMKNPELMLMAYGKDISTTQPSIDIKGVELTKVEKVKNPDYLFLYLKIDSNAKPGEYPIQFLYGKNKKVTFKFTLYQRNKNSWQRKGFNTSDAIYLIMPDRFSNGDTSNDNESNLLERCNRTEPFGRHGGDIKGIMDHLDYIQSLGMTAIWLTPILENNQQHSSYHGYSITDYYKVDPRLGTNETYKKLAVECHKRGMKIIMDMVFNHCGSNHWWMNDLPFPEWIHQFPEYTSSNYRPSVMSDIHASKADIIKNIQGWFDRTMPDMNLSNSMVLTYLIQNSIWWIEYAQLDGIRMDTYPYPEKEAMSEWLKALNVEYPDFNVVGEVWITNTSKLCYWQKNAPNRDGFNTNLPTLMDFPLTEAIQKAFNEEDGYDTGLSRIYNVIADDFLFPDPDNKVIFAENHDWARIFEFLGNDINKMKMAMTLVSTMRGIPQFYYGSELLMTGNSSRSHAEIRKDFPGGWKNDSINAFRAEGRTNNQNEMIDYLTKLLNYRKNQPALQFGQLIQFIPENNVYAYFRIYGDQGVMIVFNNHPSEIRKIDIKRYAEILENFKTGFDIFLQQMYNDFSQITIPAKSCKIIELRH
jgi:glycosidase